MPSSEYFTVRNARLRNAGAGSFGGQMALLEASTQSMRRYLLFLLPMPSLLPMPWQNLLCTYTE